MPRSSKKCSFIGRVLSYDRLGRSPGNIIWVAGADRTLVAGSTSRSFTTKLRPPFRTEVSEDHDLVPHHNGVQGNGNCDKATRDFQWYCSVDFCLCDVLLKPFHRSFCKPHTFFLFPSF